MSRDVQERQAREDKIKEKEDLWKINDKPTPPGKRIKAYLLFPWYLYKSMKQK